MAHHFLHYVYSQVMLGLTVRFTAFEKSLKLCDTSLGIIANDTQSA